MAESQPLFVRLPVTAAERLERASKDTGASKREIITRLIIGDDLTVGGFAFRPTDDEVLTLEEVAALLRVEPQVVRELATAGELPSRELAGEWRFARAAVLAWLASEHTTST